MSKKEVGIVDPNGVVATGICLSKGCGGKTTYKVIDDDNRTGPTLNFIVTCGKCKGWWESEVLPETESKR
jgi:hypothetical protein